MIIKYEFNTQSEEFDKSELKRIEKSLDLAGCIWTIEQQLREWYKHDKREGIPIEEIKERIEDIIKEYGINTDELYI